MAKFYKVTRTRYRGTVKRVLYVMSDTTGFKVFDPSSRRETKLKGFPSGNSIKEIRRTAYVMQKNLLLNNPT